VTTPVASVQPFVDALKTALAASSVALGDGVKPSTATTRYIVAWFNAGTVTDSSLLSRDGFTVVGTFHCYGQTPEAARFAYRALTAAVLALAGQTLGDRMALMPEQLTALPLQRDDDLSPPLYDAVCEWRIPTCLA
jgi:DNA-binding PucR family transcriptional regulator